MIAYEIPAQKESDKPMTNFNSNLPAHNELNDCKGASHLTLKVYLFIIMYSAFKIF